MIIQSLNPFNLTVNAELEDDDDSAVKLKLELAAKTFIEWKNTSFAFRKNLMLACANQLLLQKKDLAHTITIEMGKPIKEATAEIEKCASVCRYYAEEAEGMLVKEVVKTEALKSYVSFEPLGCILAVMPWNFPFWQVFRFAAPALMAGNVGVLKHASNVPLCAIAIERIFRNSGFPEGVFQSMLIGPSKIPSLISNNVIKAVTLTGSEQAGAQVASLAGKYIKKTVLELGGSDPFIVMEDADIKKAATVAVKSRMVNGGQSCIAAKRFIVLDKVFDQFVQVMQQEMMNFKMDDPLKEETNLGPMARKDLLEELIKKVNLSVQKGARTVLGGNKSGENHAFMEPTLLLDVAPGMPAYSEELFGPVASIFKVKNADQAIQIANDTSYGLGASVWSSDIEKAEDLAKKINAGCVFVNTMVASDPKLPFGGINVSGYGRELSNYGIKEFVNIKSFKMFAS